MKSILKSVACLALLFAAGACLAEPDSTQTTITRTPLSVPQSPPCGYADAETRWRDDHVVLISNNDVATSRVSNSTAPPPAVDVPQIKHEDHYAIGQKIVLSFTDTFPDAKAQLDWTLPDLTDTESLDSGRKLLVWARPGQYDVQLVVSYTIMVMVPDPADSSKGIAREVKLPPYVYSARFTVGEAPNPQPEPNPNPNPQPQPPVELSALAKLVPDPAHRKLLHEFFSDLSEAVVAGQFDTLEHYRAGYRDAIVKAKASGLLSATPGVLTPIDKPISDRVMAGVGNDPATKIEGVVRATLAGILADVAKDFNM